MKKITLSYRRYYALSEAVVSGVILGQLLLFYALPCFHAVYQSTKSV